MNEQAIRFRLGVFVLASLILLAVLITMFGGFPNYFKRTDLYTLEFTNAQGVSPGTPVRRSGVRIGEARKVGLDNVTGKVRVVIQVDDGFTLRRGDKPTILQGLLAGDTAIAFLPPEDEKLNDPTPVEPGQTLVGYTALDAGALLQKTSDLVPPAQDAMIEIRKVFQKIDKLLPTIDEAARSIGNVAKGIEEVGPELRKTNMEIQGLTKDARIALKKIDPAIVNIQMLTDDARKAMANVAPTIEEVRKTAVEIQAFSKETKKLLPKIEPLIEKTTAAVDNWSVVGERVNVLLKTNEEKINKIVASAEDSMKRIGEFMNEENAKNVQSILRSVRKSSDRFEGITMQVEDLVKDGQGSFKKINNTLIKAEEFFANLQSASKPFADKSPAILKNLDEATANLNKTLGDMRELLQVVARGDGTIQRLLSDPSLFNNVNDAASMAGKLMPRLDRILRDVETFADKIARHPESLGVSGVVRPGSGLKENSIYPTWKIIPR